MGDTYYLEEKLEVLHNDLTDIEVILTESAETRAETFELLTVLGADIKTRNELLTANNRMNDMLFVQGCFIIAALGAVFALLVQINIKGSG